MRPLCLLAGAKNLLSSCNYTLSFHALKPQAYTPATCTRGRPSMSTILVHVTTGPEDPTRAALAFLVAKRPWGRHTVNLFLAGDAATLLRDATDSVAARTANCARISMPSLGWARSTSPDVQQGPASRTPISPASRPSSPCRTSWSASHSKPTACSRTRIVDCRLSLR